MSSLSEQLHSLRSKHLKNERSIWVRTPLTDESPRNLVIFLDGELYREKVGATGVIDQLVKAEDIPPTIFIFVSMVSMETRAIECPCYPSFAHFIIEELLPWLERQEPDIKNCDNRTLVGLSYTGLAATYVALRSPNTFTKIISQSGSYWWNDCWLVEQYARLKTQLPIEFYLDVGNKEIQTEVDHGHVQQAISQIEGVSRLRDVLFESGHTVNYFEFDGHHDTAKWRETLPGALKWVLNET
tara:strand:- start:613 stop:1338 length:726 start_codon:yes stop_codon:yes gene_type:complete